MTNTICGHERDALVATLNVCVWQTGIDYDVVPMDVFLAARTDVFDPAKLAEMLAERGQELGLDVATYSRRAEWLNTKPTEWATFQTWHYTCDNNTERGVSLHSRNENGYDWTMPQARAILLAWLRLPNGAREEAERVLRGEPMRDPRVDWTNDLRPAVLGGECARCFHRAPLHEPGCVLLKCVAPNPCACRKCTNKR